VQTAEEEAPADRKRGSSKAGGPEEAICPFLLCRPCEWHSGQSLVSQACERTSHNPHTVIVLSQCDLGRWSRSLGCNQCKSGMRKLLLGGRRGGQGPSQRTCFSTASSCIGEEDSEEPFQTRSAHLWSWSKIRGYRPCRPPKRRPLRQEKKKGEPGEEEGG
jgi:hypothetical protein